MRRACGRIWAGGWAPAWSGKLLNDEGFPITSSTADLQRFSFGYASSPHGQEHPAEVGNQSDGPHHHAELVEVEDGLLVSANQDRTGPHGVNDHQQDGQHASHPVKVKG
jgi:hypothetical protein